MFYRGQRIICVSDNFVQRYMEGRPNLVVRGQEYTVRDVFKFPYQDQADWGLLVHEVVNPQCNWDNIGLCEIPFWTRRFRPITDISIFTAMLKPVKEDA